MSYARQRRGAVLALFDQAPIRRQDARARVVVPILQELETSALVVGDRTNRDVGSCATEPFHVRLVDVEGEEAIRSEKSHDGAEGSREVVIRTKVLEGVVATHHEVEWALERR